MLLIPTLLCPKAWEGMSGNEATRFCSYCKKNVHNLEALSVSERLALLSSPAASLCARYQVAIRRPVIGKEEAYRMHLLKHGVGVAVTSSVLLVLWEMRGEAEKDRFYRTVATTPSPHYAPFSEMPKQHYCETRMTTLGIMMPMSPPRTPLISGNPSGTLAPHVDVHLDPVAIDQLIEEMKATVPIAARPKS